MTGHTDCDLDHGFMAERVAALEAKLAASIESEREALELLRVSDAAHRTACNELANVTAECESETRWAHQYQREAETLRAEVARLTAENDKFASVFNYPSADIVCVCGCHDNDHEPCDEEGYGCGVDDHECVWAPRSVATIVGGLRAEVERLTEVVEVAERCANDGCGQARTWAVGKPSLWCPDIRPGQPDEWCWCCQLRAALARAKGEK